MPTGRTAANLRELLQELREAEEAVLYYHLWQSRLAIAHQVVEYPNDFAAWAATALMDSKLAEILSSIDPFSFDNTEEMRDTLADLLEGYLWDLPHSPMARPGFEFYFCKASTVVLRSHISAGSLIEFCPAFSKVGLDSIYYHFVDARWRLRSSKRDDFSSWIESSYGLPELVAELQGIDSSFYSLDELRSTITEVVNRYIENNHGRTERL